MIQLRVLGSLQITGPDGRSVERLISRSRRAALLAYLGAAGPSGLHRRDKLLAMFWPEATDGRARAALNQALYVLRTELGDDVIVTTGEEVGLNPDAVWCDATAFETALDGGRPADALSLYRGDLLDGFYVAEALEFERWMERERARLRRRAADAAWALAELTAAQGNVVDAERWARQATDFLPADEAVVRRLMTFLHQHGDRAAAIQAYETFVGMLQREYELQPSAETASLASAIRLEEQRVQSVRLAAPKVAGARPWVGERPEQVPARHRRRYVRAALGAVAALGAIALGLMWPSREAAAPEGPPRLAVLPFENLGESEEKYFSDGLTDELSSRLTEIRGLLVISRTSTAQYAGVENLSRIGRELGVEYVVEGTVRTDRTYAGVREVRITPRLVRVRDGALIWSDRYTATTIPGQIFRAQSDIAEHVADALKLALGEGERRVLAADPTDNPYAYDFYLRGLQHTAAGYSELDNRLARDMYERAIRADSGFALAYARLAQTHALAYWFFYDRSSSRIAAAKKAAERAVALDPELPEAHLALGYYHYWGRLAFEDALAEFRTALRLGLNSAELFKSIAVVQRRQGKLDEAIVNFEKGFVRDPRDMHVAFNLAQTHALRGSASDAERFFDRAILLSPQSAPSYWNKAWLHLNTDRSTAKARAVLEMAGVPKRDSVIEYLAAWIDMVDGRHAVALRRLKSSSPATENQWHYVPNAQLRAAVYERLGRVDLARAWYDSARVMSEQRVRAQPGEANFHSALAISYAGLGRKREAVREARSAVELLPVTSDAVRGLHRLRDLARVYAMIGEPGAALSELERLANLPGGRSILFLELDPVWNPVRAEPRFQALLQRKG